MPSATRHTLLALLSAGLVAVLFLPSVSRSFGDWASWSVSDLHINYAAGFVRRGLLGEFGYLLQDRAGLSTGVFFPTLFVALTAGQIALQAALAWPLRARPDLFLVVMLAPALILFPAYDYGGYLRKEAFITIGLFGHALLVRRVLCGRLRPLAYSRFLYFGLAPYLAFATLIHETQALFLPAHALLMYMAHGYPRAAAHGVRVQIPVLMPAVISFFAAVVSRGDPEKAGAICASWQGRADIACDAILFLGHGYDQVWHYLLLVANAPSALWTYAATIVLALVPPVLLRRVLPPEGQAPLALLLGAAAPMTALFLLGWDIGRWIHMISVGLISLILAGAVRYVPAPPGRSPLHLAAIGGAFLYVATWRVNVCCLPTSLKGGLAQTLADLLP